ncbi:hypothetical protein LCGC14_0123570 [marine sediment metagenome]|uniref:Uncharacterized protein n=1 Tax=marine sediment metagenome TaxID=412755 RepID=A0A0F9Y8I4_9ZZZZ|nr:hypothetical protein [Maribacter sp.]HDZ05810.1 hypothetical protein [Maribacter sp.]
MNREKLYIILLIFLLFLNCVQNQNHEILEYMQNIHNIKNIEKGLFVFMPTNACSGCYDSIMEELNSNTLRANTRVVLMGDSNITLAGRAKKFEQQDRILFDISNSLSNNITDYRHPFIFVIVNNEIEVYIDVIPEKLEYAKEIIRKYNSEL